jgi:hypothetical protein
MGWEPERFAVGDTVVDPDRPLWGIGRVVEDRTFARSPTVGQRLVVEWAGRGLVSVFTAQRVLRRSPPPEAPDDEPGPAADRGRR